MVLWVRSAGRALGLWGRGGEPAWACRHRVAGGSRPAPSCAGGSRAFGDGGGDEKEKRPLQDIAELIRAQAGPRVVVMAGAGISTASGIPDFRSPGTGFYSALRHWDLPYPEAIFELSFFLDNPRPFFAWAKSMYPGNFRPNTIHYFLRLLHDRGLLRRLYTQNIDGLESASGIPGSKLVEAHGSFASATCTCCGAASPERDFWAAVMADRVPRCAVCTGLVKPDIVFFGEALPERFFLHVVDFPAAELLLILGTSLKVEPFASLSEAVRGSVPRVLMNREAAESWRPRSRDVVQLGDLVHSVERLVALLGWTEQMRDLVQRESSKVPAPCQVSPPGGVGPRRRVVCSSFEEGCQGRVQVTCGHLSEVEDQPEAPGHLGSRGEGGLEWRHGARSQCEGPAGLASPVSAVRQHASHFHQQLH